MSRNNRPGTIQAAVQKSYASIGGLENASVDLGVSLATLSYGTELSDTRPGGLGVNYLDRLGRIDAAAAVPIAEHFSRLAGGVFQPVTAGRDVCLASQASEIFRETGEAMAATMRAIQQSTASSASSAITEIDEAIAALGLARAKLVAMQGGC